MEPISRIPADIKQPNIVVGLPWLLQPVAKVVPMALNRALALALVLIPATARAECTTEAVKARDMIMASGPFQYSGKYIKYNCLSLQQLNSFDRCHYFGQLDKPSEHQLSGLIDPFKAHHIFDAHSTTLWGHVLVVFPVVEEIAIGNLAWLRGEAGWFQPTRAVGQPDIIVALTERFSGELPIGRFSGASAFSKHVVSAKCFGSTEVDGKKLNGYELQYEKTYREQVFVEPETGLTVRLEQIHPNDYISINFRYDASIKIEPPKIGADAPEVPVPTFAATKF